MMKRRMKATLWMVSAMTFSFAIFAHAEAPGPGTKQCSPGQNNVGGGPGNSGPGDQQGAPLKAPPACPGK